MGRLENEEINKNSELSGVNDECGAAVVRVVFRLFVFLSMRISRQTLQRAKTIVCLLAEDGVFRENSVQGKRMMCNKCLDDFVSVPMPAPLSACTKTFSTPN